jgi:hypothetical protein
VFWDGNGTGFWRFRCSGTAMGRASRRMLRPNPSVLFHQRLTPCSLFYHRRHIILKLTASVRNTFKKESRMLLSWSRNSPGPWNPKLHCQFNPITQHFGRDSCAPSECNTLAPTDCLHAPYHAHCLFGLSATFRIARK